MTAPDPYYTPAELRALDRTGALNNLTDFPDAILEQAIADAEADFEDITGVAWRVRAVTGEAHVAFTSRSIRLDHAHPVSVEAVTVDGNALSSDELGALVVDPMLDTLFGVSAWCGNALVVVDYSHGYPEPPTALLRAFRRHVSNLLSSDTAGVPTRATSQTIDGSTFRLASANRRSTGDLEVDAVLDRYSVLTGLAR